MFDWCLTSNEKFFPCFFHVFVSCIWFTAEVQHQQQAVNTVVMYEISVNSLFSKNKGVLIIKCYQFMPVKSNSFALKSLIALNLL